MKVASVVRTKETGIFKRVIMRLIGATRKPKSRVKAGGGASTTSENYEGMDKNYRWFRQDEVVRACLINNAFFSCLSAGFETEVDPVDPDDETDYSDLKDTIDLYNRRVNLDYALYVAQIKRSIYGSAGFEIVLEDGNSPTWLLSLQSNRLKPKQNEETWELTGFDYEGRQDFYAPEEVLYFTNMQLENDYEGLSDIEPIRDICMARHELLIENFGEIVRTVWAPTRILVADTSMMTETEEDTFLADLADQARSGKSLDLNKSIEAITSSINVDITGLIMMLDKFEQSIIAQFGTPKFLTGKPIENRATAYAELEAYINGRIASIQRYFKREIEEQWYDYWTRKILATPEGNELPVHIKHRWKPIRTTDIYQMAEAVTNLYGQGLGLLGDFEEKAWEMMGWEKQELEDLRQERLDRVKQIQHPGPQPQPAPGFDQVEEIKEQITGALTALDQKMAKHIKKREKPT